MSISAHFLGHDSCSLRSCMYVPHLCTSISWWTSGLVPSPAYHEWGSHMHGCARIPLQADWIPSGVTQEWGSFVTGIIGSSCQVWGELCTDFHGGFSS